MNGTLAHALLGTLDYLRALSRESTRPEAATAQLRLLQRQYADVQMELLWEEEPYDGSVHYDVLLRLAGEGTVSLSFCPDRVLPWPLRGVHRIRERDLVRVNNTVLTVAQAISCLDCIWEEPRLIINRLVDVCLIQEALDTDPLELSDVELQRAIDGFRRAHRLYTVEDTRRWMARRRMTHEQLERYVADQATIAKLRDRVTAGRVEAYFAAHSADFDSACIARLALSSAESTWRVYEQLRSGEVNFYEVAQRHFLAGVCVEPPPGDIFAVLRRGEAPVALREAVFTAAPGALLAPVQTSEGYAIVHVLSLTLACLDERTQSAIQKILFEEWLAERRQAARIEWYWGNADQPAQPL